MNQLNITKPVKKRCYSQIYWIWTAMKSRCYNPNNPRYKYYGAKSINVCDRWRYSFDNFYDDMGDKPEGMSLERKNNKGDYELENCKWATIKEQSLNKSNNIWLVYRGKKCVIAEWARIRGIGKSTIRERLRRGLTIQKILSSQHRI